MLCARLQVMGALRPSLGSSSDPALNAWRPQQDYNLVGGRPLNQVRRVSHVESW
jgi:hypothetical protein